MWVLLVSVVLFCSLCSALPSGVVFVVLWPFFGFSVFFALGDGRSSVCWRVLFFRRYFFSWVVALGLSFLPAFGFGFGFCFRFSPFRLVSFVVASSCLWFLVYFSVLCLLCVFLWCSSSLGSVFSFLWVLCFLFSMGCFGLVVWFVFLLLFGGLRFCLFFFVFWFFWFCVLLLGLGFLV